jgi:acetolactate synthase-1/2/3 large subunit
MNAKDKTLTGIVHDTPTPSPQQTEVWGSDVMAATLRSLDIPYIALNPGASYRGFHDSIVNYLGNTTPQMMLTVHDETAVAIAHGYYKVSEKMMAAALHSNVGLMHATMAIFNAWCDRAPVLIFGATGPWDADKRRPWIDWIHTTSDMGAIIRDYTKWDNQPGSPKAAIEAVLRGAQIAETAPRGPVYIALDAGIQEAKVGPMPALPDAARYRAPAPVHASAELIKEAAKLLSGAKNPVILAGRVGRSVAAWKARVELAEKLNCAVFTNFKSAAAFPTDHRLHAAPPAMFLGPDSLKLLAEADVILSLDWLDLGGTLKQAFSGKAPSAKIIQVSLDQHNHRGWSADYQGLPAMDLYLMCEPDAAVPDLLAACTARPGKATLNPMQPLPAAPDDVVSILGVAHALQELTKDIEVCYTRFPLGWNGAYGHFRHPLDYVGTDGGGGVGSGLGNAVGSALALKDSGRLPIAFIGDGDFLMGNTAIWTAAHYKIPMLVIVGNNRSFFNDELHQERVAIERGRPTENRWIGQRIDDPDIDLAAMARAQGVEGIGPVKDPAQIKDAIKKGLDIVKAGGICVIDMRVKPGYDSNMSGAPAAAHKR